MADRGPIERGSGVGAEGRAGVRVEVGRAVSSVHWGPITWSYTSTRPKGPLAATRTTLLDNTTTRHCRVWGSVGIATLFILLLLHLTEPCKIVKMNGVCLRKMLWLYYGYMVHII